jgi:hypothetical protein
LTEKEILEKTWEEISSKTPGDSVYSWNMDFDKTILFQRSWKNRVYIPSVFTNEKRYIFNCLMKQFCCFVYGNRKSLEAAALFLGVNQPREHNIQGKNFWKELEQRPKDAIQYLKDDVQEAWDIANIIL